MTKEYIKQQLITLGMKSSLKGFNYIIDIIAMIHNDYPDLQKWKVYYYQVGKSYNVSDACVEKSIRHALETLRDNLHNYEQIDYYFGYDNCENSTSLLKFYDRLTEDRRVEVKQTIDLSLLEDIIKHQYQSMISNIINEIIEFYSN